MDDSAKPPFLAIAVVLDGGARAAAVTRSHADAYERALSAAEGADISGVDLIELSINPTSFLALRKIFQLDENTVGLYDLFPLAGHLAPELRTVASQFLAAEALWALEEQGQLGGIPLNLKLSLPKGWKSDPKELHERLVTAGALDLSPTAIQTYKDVKATFDASK
jgi:hypothetical protein